MVGCGPRGLEHAGAIRAVEGLWLAAVADVSAPALDRAVARLGVPGFSGLEELLAQARPDIVVLATSPRARADLVRRAVSAPGLRALVVEKPLALNLQEGQSLVEICESYGLALAVCHQLRFAPEFVALREALAAGELGAAEFFRGSCYGNLIDQGSHILDMLRWLAGDRRLLWVMSQRGANGLSNEAADEKHPAPAWMTHYLAFEGGLRAAMETGPLAARSRVFTSEWLQKRVTAVGAEGFAEAQSAGYFKLCSRIGGWRYQTGSLEGYKLATVSFYEELRDSIVGGVPHRNCGRDALATLQGLLACSRSAELGEMVHLLLVPEPRSAAAGNASRQAPELSVIVPTPDHRGWLVECVRSWTAEQTCPPGRFELVIVSDGAEPDLEQRVRRLLRPQDRLLSLSAANEMELYEAAARASFGRILLFSEPHCLADPDCAAQVLQYFSEHDHDGACLRSAGLARNTLARLEEKLFDGGFAEFRREGDWRKVIMRGVALRRESYLEAGGFQHRYNRFAEWALAARLHSTGRRMGFISGASVRHAYTENFQAFLPAVREFTEGECAYRLDYPAGYCERYFGVPLEWTRRSLLNPDARAALRTALWKNLTSPAVWRQDRAVAQVSARRLSDCVAPLAASKWLSRVVAESRVRIAMARFHVLAIHPGRQEQAYADVWKEATRAARLAFLGRRSWTGKGIIGGPGVYAMKDLPDEDLVGFHALEGDYNQRFRWTNGAGAIYMPLPGQGPFEIEIDTAGLTGGLWLRVHYGGRPVSNLTRYEDGRITMQVAGAGRLSWLVLASSVLRPWRHGVDDRRELGLRVVQVTVRRLV